MPRLEVQHVSMQFPAVRALDDVSLVFEPGEVHGIVGENGAGKSTLMKILSGLQSPTEGTVLLDGVPVVLHGVRDALGRGIAMIHQELNLVDELTVAENIFLGREPRRYGTLDRPRMNAEATQNLEAVRATFSPTTKLGELSIAGKQLVEIAKAVAVNAQILIMDEPTAVLSETESEALFALVAELKERGVTVLYISHRLAEVVRICDRITVLRDGKWVATVRRDENPTIESLASQMVGRRLEDFYPPKQAVADVPPRLEVRNLSVPGWATGVSFTVRPGEIVWLAGLIGAGRTELCEALFGVRPHSGEVLLDGRPVRIRRPEDAMKHGIAYVSEDRKGLGLILDLGTVHNVTLANLRAYARPIVQKAREREAAERHRKELDIRVGDLEAPVLFLSGGNQQKVSLGKWLDTEPKVLLLDEPTRGVDVGAKREIYDLIHRLAAHGLACVVVSSELPEILGLCHRAVVLREGKAVGEVAGSEMTEESIMHLAAGVTR